MKLRYSIALSLPLISGSAVAAELSLKLDIPQLNVAEYHRPYIAAWLETADQQVVTSLAVLYDVKKKDKAGEKWLKDMRQWWRKSGQQVALADGVSGATRSAGEQSLNLLESKAVTALAPGQYQVVVEAARENGGREVLKLPFTWPVKAESAKVTGEGELGAIAIEAKP